MSYNLFLDDVRMPYIVGDYIMPWKLKALYRLERWDIVRNYKEFVAFIESNGIPDVVSFDHDLADAHYDPDTWKEHFKYEEETGLDCAKWLIQYCKKQGKPLPVCYCHSMNPVGKENILRELKQYEGQ